MSDVQNPIFDDEREFLERQKLEYKNALMSDVAGLKDQTTQIGKGALLLGGAMAGVWMVSKLIIGGTKKRKKKKAKMKLLQSQSTNPNSGFYLKNGGVQPAGSNQVYPEHQPRYDDEVNFGSPLDFNQPVSEEGSSSFYNTPAKVFEPQRNLPGKYSLHQHYHAASEPEQHKSFFESEFVRSLATQAMAFLLVYLSKKAEEYVVKNYDIATDKGSETHDVDFTYLNTDAGKHL
ncbi:hypothetical protein [Adhaeribacter soli]|uniref:Uncharacterized protein n=1 Tax=Adhaeribacter soli TaxID=2607655 RepID=A0A5N1IUL3_9BACT|nr:hypothetical protein [Adhaeribacter soli]KAA9331740.1 hypothetical protein F0P94_13090 [Adhaeribacter soli]